MVRRPNYSQQLNPWIEHANFGVLHAGNQPVPQKGITATLIKTAVIKVPNIAGKMPPSGVTGGFSVREAPKCLSKKLILSQIKLVGLVYVNYFADCLCLDFAGSQAVCKRVFFLF